MAFDECQGKGSWPELVGVKGEVAKATIERENPLVTADIVVEGVHKTQPIRLLSTNNIPNPKLIHSSCAAEAGRHGKNGLGRSGGGDGKANSESFRIMGVFLSGWRDRIAADPQFPFKVKMEQFVGVSACVLGDMASRPNFGLNELDFVFSTLIVGSILNFTLMYLLAPTASSSSTSSSRLPSIFASCPRSHMFEPGAYTLMNRLGTFVLKGTIFAAVGFAAGLVGTTISNGLIKMRKKMDPTFETPNKPPPTLLNALTWAIHMGVSSNLRYQTLNGIEFLLAKRSVPPFVSKSSVVVLRCLNNILGGMSFVILARMTGSQSVGGEKPERVKVAAVTAKKEKLLDGGDNLDTNQSTFK
ncbi:Proteinase inhibitor I13, potato inhibitor I [Corchorus olitorius]|uniref:Proteinase inhibitor I13, potato inhibitor I n=1 Tax=Corchorus olitorius TaxID=93759 RepID=A0A1R3K1Y6_9ROSI|nr:Proteinase inhibitor I13, potato inhibitor I [Corchorus olitorius]